MNHKGVININRILFFIVFCSNMLCAFEFVFSPENYMASYEVAKASGGRSAIQGLGVAFMMWNVTYPFYIYQPHKSKTIGMIILIQQLVGLIGELVIKYQLLEAQVILASSIMRFVYFDATGFILMLVGYLLMFKMKAFER